MPDAWSQTGDLTHGQSQHSLPAAAAWWGAPLTGPATLHVPAAVQSSDVSARGQGFKMLVHCTGYILRLRSPFRLATWHQLCCCQAACMLCTFRRRALHCTCQAVHQGRSEDLAGECCMLK